MAYELIKIRDEVSRCLLCHQAGCSAACEKGVDISKAIFSARFENYAKAKEIVESNCLKCNAECMKACKRAAIDSPVNIALIKDALIESENIETKGATDEIDLSIEFCNVKFESPFILSSSVVACGYEMIKKAFDMGWAGACFKTIGLFTPVEVSPRFAALAKESNTFVGFKNLEQISDHDYRENFEIISRLKKEYPNKVIISSIMGRTDTEWEVLARLSEEAGADIIECNFSCPQMVGDGVGSDVGANKELVARYSRAAKRGSRLPLLAKMTPNLEKMDEIAISAVEAGADGIAAINTIKSIVNIDPFSFESEPVVSGKSSVSGYSGKAIKPIALRFIHEMKSNKKLKDIPISGMGGIENWKDAYEFMALGCENLQITTAIMQYGYRIIYDLEDGLRRYLARAGKKSVKEIVGGALANLVPADELDRETTQYPKFDKKACIRCGRCYISCFDGGHQAIEFDDQKGPALVGSKCVGCQLCRLVCPAKAIGISERVRRK